MSRLYLYRQIVDNKGTLNIEHCENDTNKVRNKDTFTFHGITIASNREQSELTLQIPN